MDRFTIRLSPDLARRFDAAASARGGRSSFLRRLIESAAAEASPCQKAPAAAGTTERPTGKLCLRLAVEDLAALEAEAARSGLSRTRWVVALVHRRLHGSPQLSPPEAAAFIEVQRDLRRIGVNLNQIARTLHSAGREAGVADRELARVVAFAADIRVALRELRRAFEGNLDYWSAGS